MIAVAGAGCLKPAVPCLPQRRNEKKAECGTYQNLYWVSCKGMTKQLRVTGLSIITTDYVCTIARYGTWQKEGAFEAAADPRLLWQGI